MFGQIYAKIKDAKIIPVVKTDIPQNAVNLAGALLQGGINAIEITFRTTQGQKGLLPCSHGKNSRQNNRPGGLSAYGSLLFGRDRQRSRARGVRYAIARARHRHAYRRFMLRAH